MEGVFFPCFFYRISFPYFYHGCCCFCFFPFLGHRLESCLLFGPRAIWSERGIWNPLFEANFRFISVHIIDLFFKVADFSPKNMFGNKKKPPQILLPIHGSKDCWVETRVWRGKNFFGAKSTSHKKGHLHFIDACNEWVWFKKVSSQVGQKSSTWKSTKNSGACRMIGWSIDQAFSRSYQWAKLWLKMENSWQFLQKKTRFFTKKASSHTNHTFSWRSGVWRCFFWVWFFRDPGSPSENGFMEPRYYAFRRWLDTTIISWEWLIPRETSTQNYPDKPGDSQRSLCRGRTLWFRSSRWLVGWLRLRHQPVWFVVVRVPFPENSQQTPLSCIHTAFIGLRIPPF